MILSSIVKNLNIFRQISIYQLSVRPSVRQLFRTFMVKMGFSRLIVKTDSWRFLGPISWFLAIIFLQLNFCYITHFVCLSIHDLSTYGCCQPCFLLMLHCTESTDLTVPWSTSTKPVLVCTNSTSQLHKPLQASKYTNHKNIG